MTKQKRRVFTEEFKCEAVRSLLGEELAYGFECCDQWRYGPKPAIRGV